ncbi:MAG TPA: transglycosylase SLT domain-containing protein [Caulobacteraceae bacterium]|nr:transglycosylase SLT domain-containing protein [Caulobacteraceae bacterium]
MARIPDDLPLASVDAAPPSTAVVAPTDFGLGEAAQTADQIGEMNRRTQMLQVRVQSMADRKSIEPQLTGLIADTADQLATDAPTWNGTPGFAEDQIAKAKAKQQAVIAANPNWTSGQRSEFQAASDQAVQQFGNRAIAHEATVIQQTGMDRLEVQKNAALAGFQQDYAPAAQNLRDNYDGSQTGLTTGALSAFDAAAQKALAAAPPAAQPQLQAQLSAMRVEEAAKFGALEAHGQSAFIYKNGLDQADGVINTIASNPTAYDSVVQNNLPAIVATMPAGLRKDALHDLTAQAAIARVRGLVQTGNAPLAQSELSDGRYDAFLTPEQKEELSASADAAARANQPANLDQALAQAQIRQKAEAETYSRLNNGQSTGQVTPGDLSALPLDEAAKYLSSWTAADRAYAAAGSVRDMPTSQLAASASAAPPAPTDPDYATKLSIWQTQKAAAEAELKARQNPGDWAFASNGKGLPPKGSPASAVAYDRGAALQDLWGQVTSNTGAAQAQAAQQYAVTMLGAQHGAGIPVTAQQIVPQAKAGELAASVVNATPEGRMAAMQSVAALLHALPASVTLADGSTASPQALLGKQLLAAHMTPLELSAIADFGGQGQDAAFGRVTAALNDTTLAKGLSHAEQTQIAAQTQGALKTYLSTVAPLPGADALAQARLDRTILVAKYLVANQHMSIGQAVQTAAQDAMGGYRYVDTYRIPAAVADPTTLDFTGVHNGGQQVRAGANKMLADLTANGGANLYAPAGIPGQPETQRAVYAAALQHGARWVTQPDDSGLALALPKPDGTWTAVHDRYGRPVSATWSALQSYAAGGQAAPWSQPPPNAVRAPDGTPLPAVSKSAALQALAWAVNGQESNFKSGLTGPDTRYGAALGQMQVIPQFGAPYAQRLFGAPLDQDRLLHDDAYNRAIGQAMLSDQVQHYGSGNGLGLALAAYNAGNANVDSWIRQYGDPRTGQISLTDWVKRIPAKQTRDYVSAVLPAALGKLKGG